MIRLTEALKKLRGPIGKITITSEGEYRYVIVDGALALRANLGSVSDRDWRAAEAWATKRATEINPNKPFSEVKATDALIRSMAPDGEEALVSGVIVENTPWAPARLLYELGEDEAVTAVAFVREDYLRFGQALRRDGPDALRIARTSHHGGGISRDAFVELEFHGDATLLIARVVLNARLLRPLILESVPGGGLNTT